MAVGSPNFVNFNETQIHIHLFLQFGLSLDHNTENNFIPIIFDRHFGLH